jgi:hypothetical protein
MSSRNFTGNTGTIVGLPNTTVGSSDTANGKAYPVTGSGADAPNRDTNTETETEFPITVVDETFLAYLPHDPKGENQPGWYEISYSVLTNLQGECLYHTIMSHTPLDFAVSPNNGEVLLLEFDDDGFFKLSLGHCGGDKRIHTDMPWSNDLPLIIRALAATSRIQQAEAEAQAAKARAKEMAKAQADANVPTATCADEAHSTHLSTEPISWISVWEVLLHPRHL